MVMESGALRKGSNTTRPWLWMLMTYAILSPEIALSQSPSADTNVKETAPETGTMIKRTIASSQRFPINKKWSELSEEDRAVLRSQYEDMPDTDEPPYPIDGMAPIFRQLSVEAGRAGVYGVFVIDGVVGDYLCEKYGDLRETPLTIRVENSRLIDAQSMNRQLRDEFLAYCHTDENSDRVGEFAIGTNIAIRDVIGNILQDEKFPGIHIAFGDPYGNHTGAPWKSTTHIDVVGLEFNIWLGGAEGEEQIMRDGKFLIEA